MQTYKRGIRKAGNMTDNINRENWPRLERCYVVDSNVSSMKIVFEQLSKLIVYMVAILVIGFLTKGSISKIIVPVILSVILCVESIITYSKIKEIKKSYSDKLLLTAFILEKLESNDKYNCMDIVDMMNEGDIKFHFNKRTLRDVNEALKITGITPNIYTHPIYNTNTFLEEPTDRELNMKLEDMDSDNVILQRMRKAYGDNYMESPTVESSTINREFVKGENINNTISENIMEKLSLGVFSISLIIVSINSIHLSLSLPLLITIILISKIRAKQRRYEKDIFKNIFIVYLVEYGYIDESILDKIKLKLTKYTGGIEPKVEINGEYIKGMGLTNILPYLVIAEYEEKEIIFLTPHHAQLYVEKDKIKDETAKALRQERRDTDNAW